MYRDHTVSVVVPAYNEEKFVADVIRKIPEYVDLVYVIDDGSTDDTWGQILEGARDDSRKLEYESTSGRSKKVVMDGGATISLGDRAIVHDPIGRVVPIQHRSNRGVGGAIKTGYLAVLDDDIDITVVIGGDDQMDLDQMPKLLNPIVEKKADYAKGNRLVHSDNKTEMPTFRLFGNTILSLLTKISSGYWKLSDPQNGYTAISRHGLETVDVENMYEYYGYCNDLLVKLNTKQLRVADVPMPPKYEDEDSHIRYPHYVRKVSGMLFRNFLERLKKRYVLTDFHPLPLFYVIGTKAAIFGLLGCFWSVYVWKQRSGSLFVRATLSLLMLIFGSLFIMFAMLFDMQANEDLEVLIYE